MLYRNRSTPNRWFINRTQEQALAHSAFSGVLLRIPSGSNLVPNKDKNPEGEKYATCEETVCGEDDHVAGP